MGFLNRIFGSEESLAREIEHDDDAIRKHWNDYIFTFAEKRQLIENLDASEIDASIADRLLKLLAIELFDISSEEKEGSEIITDLAEIEVKIRRIRRLSNCLGYTRTKFEHVHGLLQHLFEILQAEFRFAEKLKAVKPEIVSSLQAQLKLEEAVIREIEQIPTFHELFVALVKGEHIIRRMDAHEKRLVERMREGMTRVFYQETEEGILYSWTLAVFNGIEDKVNEAIDSRLIDGNHLNVDLEFVNRPEFIDFAREKIIQLRKKEIPPEAVSAFVHLFREWYNERE